jgi:hypothetical protein
MPLNTNEWKELFNLIAGGGKLSEAKKKIAGWHRTTIARAYNVASKLYYRGNKTLNSKEAEEIAEEAKYNTTPHFVEHVFSQYLQWPEAKKDELCQHRSELSEVANNISNRLREIRRYYYPTDEKVGELVIDYDQPKFLELLDDPQAKWLLSHMKAEFPYLKNLKTWADLRVKDITEELLDRLSLRAAKKEFKGSCEVCEDSGE